MDEQKIRMWAWDQFKGWGTRTMDEKGKETFSSFGTEQQIEYADLLAAWVMSGKLPEDATP